MIIDKLNVEFINPNINFVQRFIQILEQEIKDNKLNNYKLTSKFKDGV